MSEIQDILANEWVATWCQPIASIKKKNVIGFEALSRGYRGDPGNVIMPPDAMFRDAATAGLALDLDRLCRRKAFECFHHVLKEHPEATMFVNLDTAVIEEGVVGSGLIMKVVEDYGIDPAQVVLEIIESRSEDLAALQRFVKLYRSQGFVIALDDVGSGHSNLDRIPLLKPDVLKIDRWLIQGMEREYHKREVFRSLVTLAHNVGAMVVAEGLETDEQVMLSLELGADLLQGYFLARPSPMNGNLVEVNERTALVAASFKQHLLDKLHRENRQHREHVRTLGEVMERMCDSFRPQFNEMLRGVVADHSVVEYAYVLDATGTQVSDTVGHLQHSGLRHFIFQPAQNGTDHGMKEYVLALRTGNRTCVTDPYISMATGKMCRTISTLFQAGDGCDYILCLDFRLASN